LLYIANWKQEKKLVPILSIRINEIKYFWRYWDRSLVAALRFSLDIVNGFLKIKTIICTQFTHHVYAYTYNVKKLKD